MRIRLDYALLTVAIILQFIVMAGIWTLSSSEALRAISSDQRSTVIDIAKQVEQKQKVLTPEEQVVVVRFFRTSDEIQRAAVSNYAEHGLDAVFVLAVCLVLQLIYLIRLVIQNRSKLEKGQDSL